MNHADFSIDGRYLIATCEFGGSLVKVDVVERKVLGYLTLSQGGMPQDIRLAPDVKAFFVAEMAAGGVYVVDGDTFRELAFIPTGIGAHALYPSRDATKFYVTTGGRRWSSGRHEGPGASRSWTSFGEQSTSGGRSPAEAARTWGT